MSRDGPPHVGYVYGMHKTTVYLTDELRATLTRLSREHGRSEAELIREAIGALARSLEAPEPRLPLFRGSGSPVAERIDEELDGFGES